MWFQTFHHYLKKAVPFFYIRNWYTGHFEFSLSRFLYTALALVVVIALVVFAWWLGRPLDYARIP